MDSVALFIQIIRKNVLFLLNSNLRLYKFRHNVENHDGDMSETMYAAVLFHYTPITGKTKVTDVIENA